MALKKFDSLNVIPLVDVMLVLLAIVLTTSTLIEKKLIPVDLPKAKSAKVQLEHKNISITITKDSKLFIKGKEVLKTAFKSKIQSFDTNSTILINCDKNTPFKSFIGVLDTLKSSNFKNIAIVSKEND